MELEKAMSHLQKKIGLSRYSTDYDKACMNEIIKFYNGTIDKKIHDNELFAKLFIFLYTLLLQKYETTVWDNFIQSKITAILKRTPAQLIERLKNQMNDSELYRLFDMADRKDFADIHLDNIKSFYLEKGMSESDAVKKVNEIENQRKESNETLFDLLDSNKELRECLANGKEIWKFDTVSENICAMINTAIDKYSPEHLYKA